MTECKVCQLISGKEQGKKIYEDNLAYAFLSNEPSALGHVEVYPKEHFPAMEDIPEKTISHMFFVASYAATGVFEGLGAQGTNIIGANGKDANARSDHFTLHVLPRKEGDELDFKWEPKKIEQAQMDEIQNRINNQTFYIGKEEISQPPKPEGDKSKPPTPGGIIKDDNYMVKQLRRIP